MRADVIVIGGGVGGCAAALAAAKMGRRVIMTEETDWIGGQLTSQAVPPDEHPWIERMGATASYRAFRDGVRAYYLQHYPVSSAARRRVAFNPGNGWVSRLCHEPRVALAVLDSMLAPYVSSGLIRILTRHRVRRAGVNGDRVAYVSVQSLETGHESTLEAPIFLDATETGALLPLTGTEYVTGAESQAETGELHARTDHADPWDIQAITYCFALSIHPGEDHTIAKPEMYDFWRGYQADFWPGKQLGWVYPMPDGNQPKYLPLFPHDEHRVALWHYRRILDQSNFEPGSFPSDITLVNWPQNDYWLGPVYEVDEDEAARHLQAAKQLSLSLLYWLQTEAPRHDGGQGYPELRLRPDVVGTEDGLAKYPYIRESRRIRAEFTVLEQHVGVEARSGATTAERFADSVGVGCYRIDLHPSTAGRAYIDVSSFPFQIPLGALIPVRMRNLLAAGKNLGVSHITNGCYRLHPVEWNIGEAAGALAAFCVEKGFEPTAVRNTPKVLADFQRLLVNMGVELAWPAVHAV